MLGTLNGLAQTLSAAGRAIGPILSGSLFSLGTHVKPKGEVLAWGVFGGVAFVGFCISFAINNPALEADAQEQGFDGGGDEDDHNPTVPEEARESDSLLFRQNIRSNSGRQEVV